MLLLLNISRSGFLGLFTSDEEVLGIIDKVWLFVNANVLLDVYQRL
jgi:hypothetical protein